MRFKMSEISIRRPNSEQVKAIEHHGGVLLSAGAGSGKTFVLIEHMVYLISEFVKKNETMSKEELSQSLKTYLGKIVLMTFTKKAAGELALRLSSRIELAKKMASQEGSSLDASGLTEGQWKLVGDCLGSLSLTTIHGFCFKLLSNGYFPGFDPEQDIITEIEFKKKLESLFNLYLNEVLETKSDKGENLFIKSILLNKQNILKAFQDIFQTPELRYLWKNFDEHLEDLFDEESLTVDLIKVLEIEDLLQGDFRFSFEEKKKTPKWQEFIQDFDNYLKSITEYDLGFFLKSAEYFKSKGRFPAVRKGSVDSEVLKYFEKVKELRSFCSENEKDILSYLENKDERFFSWAKELKKIYHFIEEQYHTVPGVTFSDLEYYVLLGLQNEEACQRVHQDIDYIIIDEFQDTSEIQFQIIKKILSENLEKLFCVGDVKQAIYGFRGGELGVFHDCSKAIPKVMFLKNNYRSKGRVIDFNNKFFEYIFTKGHGYQGEDRHTVDFEFQTAPFEDYDIGDLKKLKVNLEKSETSEGKKKLSTAELDYIESLKIVDFIKRSRLERPEEEICILYRKLSPVRYLLPLMIENDLDFSCQIKVPLAEDPILGMAKILVESLLSDYEHKKDEILYSSIKINLYLKYVGLENQINEECIKDFFVWVQSWGFEAAYLKFLSALKICNSNFENNLSLLKAILKDSGEDYQKMNISFEGHIKGNYSLEFQKGVNPKLLQVMTAHASKGLEFETVILGGIHTNGNSAGFKDYLGRLPWSFRWYSDDKMRRPLKSPVYLYESLLKKKKEFSEGKRLFYVASTRAQERVVWPDINLENVPQLYTKNSWIQAIRSWESEDGMSKELSEHIFSNLESDESSFEELGALDINELSNRPPLFHLSPLGILENDGLSSLQVLSELSVTRVAMLEECPRKFYFKNILKLEDGEVSSLKKNEEENIDIEFPSNILRNSAERGTSIHEWISWSLQRNWQVHPDAAEKKDIKALEWILGSMDYLKFDYDLLSETPLKFEFFGHMISGTPDLIALPKQKDGVIEVWDFKTGRMTEEKLAPYWFQLRAYAYACHILKMGEHVEFKLVLAFVDEEKLVVKNESFEKLSHELGVSWEKVEHPAQANSKHCVSCGYGNICQIS
jgi:ATP-dependent helicase/nuclease subunit A